MAAMIARISRFFYLRLPENCGFASGTAAPAAVAAWRCEPHDSTSGIAIAPLRGVADLQQQRRVHPSGTSCYPAALADLRYLESATRADIAASAAEFTGRGGTVYGADIAFLRFFFMQLDGDNSCAPQNVLRPRSQHC